MTNNEAIGFLQSRVDLIDKCYPDVKDYREALVVAIKALEQETSDDCISRQAVNALVDELARAISDERCCVSRGRATSTIMQDILDLPSVTPQPKIGEWLKNGELCRCSNCHNLVLRSVVRAYNYCSRCGAKMEVKE